MEGRDTRSRLIEAATTEFLAHGYGEANVGRIASAAGMSKKTIYKHFSSKEALLYAVMQKKIVTKLADIGSLDLKRHPRERLVSRLMAFAELAFSADSVTSYRLFMSEGFRFEGMAKLYVGFISSFGIEPLARDLKAYVDASKLSLDDPHLAARMLMAMVFGEPMRDAGLGIAEPPTVDEARKLIDGAVALFLRGALPRKTVENNFL
ncbi:TetR family transcriptional regulator [Rhizobium sp. ERR 922]|uniref:TetR/AcrR family transcriptional regulator n=1 Tax=unclassified Rhizobium TaxID=2613769 RepID=UPI0011A5B8D9|nr:MULTISPECIES: TetR/AcrR family transcriptional regulator [unclassified Rhizobium]TWB46420.1 TetR family transcriptional regulator [Rhizobium sp. ERR 922]TWB88787.1 TetR family transcriptional regulator [Rhizobium sp. ERR 942]